MSALSDRFQEAGDKRAGYPPVSQGWPVFKEYKEEPADDDILLEAVGEERSLKRHIAPLTQHKDLFLKFARHIPDAHIPGRVPMEEAVKVVRAWISEYGVLGLYGVDDPRHPGRRESVRKFWDAATKAAMILDLYGAAIPKKPDKRLCEVLMRWEPDQNWGEIPVRKQREYALERVGNKVGQIVKDECYPQLWRAVSEGRNETRGFTYDLGFHSLLGAMYLQMMLLLTDADNVRQCQRRGCDDPLPPGSNKNRMYCSDACKQWEWDNKES